jgi:hypothetical protein
MVNEYRTRLVDDVVTGKLDVRYVAARLRCEEDADDWLEDALSVDPVDDGTPEEPTEDSAVESEVTA